MYFGKTLVGSLFGFGGDTQSLFAAFEFARAAEVFGFAFGIREDQFSTRFRVFILIEKGKTNTGSGRENAYEYLEKYVHYRINRCEKWGLKYCNGASAPN